MMAQAVGARQRSMPINAAWLSGPQRALAARFDGMADVERGIAAACDLLADAAWAAALLAPLIEALDADPWFEPPFRASRDPLRTGAVLLDGAGVAISATVIGAARSARLPAPVSVVVPGRVSVTRYVRGGGGRMRRWRTDRVPAQFDAAAVAPCVEIAPLALTDGMVVTHDGRTQGHVIEGAQDDIVALTVSIKFGAEPLTREYRIADGSFIHAASADEAASRIEMLLTFLRVSGRADAAMAFDGASRHPAFHLRWAAMREWLMLDARAARPRLAELARDDADAQIRAAAATTLAALDRRLAAACHG
jgi:hypothetical protein